MKQHLGAAEGYSSLFTWHMPETHACSMSKTEADKFIKTYSQYSTAQLCKFNGRDFIKAFPMNFDEFAAQLFEPQDPREILSRALAWGKQKYPDAPLEHHAAFANAVLFLLKKEESTPHQLGGPSCRERAVIAAIYPYLNVCQFNVRQALEYAESWCYGQINPGHLVIYRDFECFDDAPEDIEKLKQLARIQRRALALARAGFCLICQGELAPNNRTGICSVCQQNSSKTRIEDALRKTKSTVK